MERKDATPTTGPSGLPSPVEDGGGLHGPSLSRRALCAAGTGLSVAALLGGAGAPGRAAAPRPLHYVVTDRRYPQSLEFGDSLVRQGAPRLEVTGGLTRLWAQALAPLWGGEGGVVAGLTLRATWTCLAEQARGCGRRSILVGHHALAEHGEGPAHLLSAPSPVLDAAAALDRCGDAWPRLMADLAGWCASSARPAGQGRYRTSTAAATASDLVLTSWIIA